MVLEDREDFYSRKRNNSEMEENNNHLFSLNDNDSETDDGEAFDLTQNDISNNSTQSNISNCGNNNNSNTRSESSGSITRTPTPTNRINNNNNGGDSDVLAFFQETGLSEDALEQLGINLEEIKAQRQLERRTEQDRLDRQLAQQMQQEFNHTTPTNSQAENLTLGTRFPVLQPPPPPPPQQQQQQQPLLPGSFPTQTGYSSYPVPPPPPPSNFSTLGVSPSYAQMVQNLSNRNMSRQLPTSFQQVKNEPQLKRAKMESITGSSSSSSSSAPIPPPPTIIELSDGEDDCVDLTDDSPHQQILNQQQQQPFTPWANSITSNTPSSSITPSFSMPRIPFQPYSHYSSSIEHDLDEEDDEEDDEEGRLYALDIDDIENPYMNPQFLFNSSAGRQLPFGKGSFGFDTRYNVPFSQFRKPLSNEDHEKELKALLENIQFDDDTSSPQDRTGTPERLKVTLMEHQKVGLQWLKRMEESSNKGGILSDDMGLGKTIQAMALIADRPCSNATPHGHLQMMRWGKRRANQELIKTKATLVVCPVSLVAQWERELVTKTNPPLNVYVYHGSNRTSDETVLAEFDVIITAYTLVGNDLTQEVDRRGPLGRLKFHRVILDEAHTIKNERTIMATSCCRLDATYRWCMTATPIQNRIEELYSLIRFLRIRPYCEWEEFRDQIKKPLNNGDQEHALKKVQALLKAIALRRSKKAKIDGRPILKLPERNVHFTHVDFTPDERNFYDFINKRSQAQFNKYVKQGTVMKNYSSVLVLLLRLRQACLHPKLTMVERNEEEESIDESAQENFAVAMNPTVVNRLLHDDNDFSQIECPICMDMADQAQIIPDCGHMLCRECLFNYLNTEQVQGEKRCPQCRGNLCREKVVSIEMFLKVHAPDLHKEFIEERKANETEQAEANTRAEELPSSTKIDKMLEVLHETRRTTKNKDKTIVFSQFTAFLNIMEKPLRENEFEFVRFDGSMTLAKRDEVLQTFYNDPKYTVLLVSTKCGSLGLNLTCANRVILMDIWWNPALENQAIDRVHRIGQRKNVEVHRIFINGTVEDRILELQRQKQALADGALGEGKAQKLGRLGLDELMHLFRGTGLRGSNPSRIGGNAVASSSSSGV